MSNETLNPEDKEIQVTCSNRSAPTDNDDLVNEYVGLENEVLRFILAHAGQYDICSHDPEQFTQYIAAHPELDLPRKVHKVVDGLLADYGLIAPDGVERWLTPSAERRAGAVDD